MQNRILTAVALFVATMWFAHAQNWRAADVAWSMWLASLIVGYAIILFSIFIADPVSVAARASRKEAASAPVGDEAFAEESARSMSALKSGWTGAAIWGGRLFLLGFFTLHFGMFHSVHAIFLQEFFPLEALGDDDSFSFNVLNYLRAAFVEYWPFVIAAGLAQAGLLLRAYKGEKPIAMMTPYGAVVKNHLVILTLGALTVIAPQANILWLLLMVYFFPWGVLGEVFGGEKETPLKVSE